MEGVDFILQPERGAMFVNILVAKIQVIVREEARLWRVVLCRTDSEPSNGRADRQDITG